MLKELLDPGAVRSERLATALSKRVGGSLPKDRIGGRDAV
jgi:hypothetical protein